MTSGYAKYSGLGGGGGGGSALTFIDSIADTAGVVSLVNDSVAPGNSQYYGTNALGTLGYYPVPAGMPPTSTQQVYVSTGGSDVTGDGSILNPFATVPHAMGTILDSSPSKVYAITLSPGTYSVDGMVWTNDVLIAGAQQQSTFLDFGTTGVTFGAGFDTSSSSVGGMYDITVLNNGNPAGSISLDMSAVTQEAEFWIVTCGINDLTFTSMSSNLNTLNVGVVDTITLLTATGGFYGYNSSNDFFNNVILDGTNGTVQGFFNNATINLTLSIQNAGTNTVFAQLDGGTGAIFAETGMLTIDGSQAVVFGGPSFIPPAAFVTFSGGAVDGTNLVRNNDVYAVGYTPTTSTDWSTVPFQAQQALDDLASSGISKSQSQNLFLASPNGSAGLSSFRAIVAADLPAGAGTVSSVSVVTANGFAGTVATATTTPAITLSTSVTGILQGNGTAISAATVGNLTESGSANLTVTGGTSSVLGSGVLLTLTGSTLLETTSSVLTITGGTNAVLGTGVTIAVKQAATAQSGYLSSTDWNTFNGKQAAGNYITALNGDGTASGPGSAALTLATVNSNVGSFTNANVTVNAKGLITAASNGSGGSGFVLQTSSTGSAEIPSGTTAQRDVSPANGYTRYNSDTKTMEFYSNGAYFPLDIGFSATNTQAFTSTGIFSFSVPSGVTKLAVLMVGGGGGGGGGAAPNESGGGGGAGAVVWNTAYAVAPSSAIRGYVALAGAGGGNTGAAGTAGQNTYFGSLIALGGSGGAGAGGNETGRGNGGGQSVNNTTQNHFIYNFGNQNSANQITVSLAAGSTFGFFDGGTAAGTSLVSELAGGGAGASGNGGNAVAATNAGNGGTGITLNGSSYGGGGGGGSYLITIPAGTGGTGGGAAGGAAAAGSNGTANTGGGGGGGAGNFAGGNGGTGYVAIFY